MVEVAWGREEYRAALKEYCASRYAVVDILY